VRYEKAWLLLGDLQYKEYAIKSQQRKLPSHNTNENKSSVAHYFSAVAHLLEES